MRILAVLALLGLPVGPLLACSCASSRAICSSVGQSAAVFTGTVVSIADEAARPPTKRQDTLPDGRVIYRIRSVDSPKRYVRLRVHEVLSGIPAGQTEAEIVTGFGGGDCGYPFAVGTEYVVYAYRDANGRLGTGTCSRTKPAAAGAEDVTYIRRMAAAPPTSQLSVRIGYPDSPGPAGVAVLLDGPGGPYTAQTDTQGIARFPALSGGEYVVHQQQDGRLTDDPKVTVYPKGCVETTLLRRLWLRGRVITEGGMPAARIEVQAKSLGGREEGQGWTDADGRYELSIARAGAYRLGVNLFQAARKDSPYPAWFYPGTKDPADAFVINFSGRPEARTFDLTLPEPLPERQIRGVAMAKEGLSMPDIRIYLIANGRVVTSQTAEKDGSFSIRGYAENAYVLHAVWNGVRNNRIEMSATPVTIPAGEEAVEFRMVVDQPGNSYMESQRRKP